MSPILIGNHKEIPIAQAEVMGILNITPDSFYSGSRIHDLEVLKSAENMLNDEALILDKRTVLKKEGDIYTMSHGMLKCNKM